MPVLKFKRFTRPQLLRCIGRKLLASFFDKFQPELAAKQITMPDCNLSDTEWTDAVVALLARPEDLPDSFCEALYAIDEMATPEGQDQLERALAEAGLLLKIDPASSRQDIALQAWLSEPALLARIRNRQRLLRLTAFEYFGTYLDPGARPGFEPPGEHTLRAITASLDPWFARHHRGHNTSRVELYTFAAAPEPGAPARAEYWFLVRHGDTFTRASKVEEQNTGIIHFRPQRDDVVVYSPGEDELRVNARTRGERELYVRTFGAHLRGAEDYFCARNTYTLEPLRSHGADALGTEQIPGLTKVTLRRIEVIEEGTDKLVIRAGRDLFKRRPHSGGATDAEAEIIPRAGRLRSADFDLHFAGCPRPRPMQIRVPNVLKLRRHCDMHVVERLVSRFRVRPGVDASRLMRDR